jgi:hypothetical protein
MQTPPAEENEDITNVSFWNIYGDILYDLFLLSIYAFTSSSLLNFVIISITFYVAKTVIGNVFVYFTLLNRSQKITLDAKDREVFKATTYAWIATIIIALITLENTAYSSLLASNAFLFTLPLYIVYEIKKYLHYRRGARTFLAKATVSHFWNNFIFLVIFCFTYILLDTTVYSENTATLLLNITAAFIATKLSFVFFETYQAYSFHSFVRSTRSTESLLNETSIVLYSDKIKALLIVLILTPIFLLALHSGDMVLILSLGFIYACFVMYLYVSLRLSPLIITAKGITYEDRDYLWTHVSSLKTSIDWRDIVDIKYYPEKLTWKRNFNSVIKFDRIATITLIHRDKSETNIKMSAYTPIPFDKHVELDAKIRKYL